MTPLVHVYGPPEPRDRMLARDEFLCSSARPFDEERRGAVAVVYHLDCRTRTDEEWECPACGACSGGPAPIGRQGLA